LQGQSTAEIANGLCITLNTVQGYLKSIFDKVGVRSRRELVAQLFHQHYLGEPVEVDKNPHKSGVGAASDRG